MPSETPIRRDVVLGIAREAAGEGEAIYEIKDASSVGFSIRRRTNSGAVAIRAREVSHAAEAQAALNRFIPSSQRVARYNTVGSVVYEGARFVVTTRRWEHQLLVRSPTYRSSVFPQSMPLSRHQKLRRVHTLVQVVTGLADLDRSGLAHGDLRPGNIAMRQEGAVLLDYGLPSPRASLASYERRYLSPSLLDGDVPTSSDDIYSLGVLMAEFVYRHLEPGERVPLLNVSAEYLEWLSDSCMTSKPSRRPTIRALYESFLSGASYEDFTEYLEASSRRLQNLILNTQASSPNTYISGLQLDGPDLDITLLNAESTGKEMIDFREDALDRLESILYNQTTDGKIIGDALEAFDPGQLPHGIDSRWQAFIARDYLWAIDASQSADSFAAVYGALRPELQDSLRGDLEEAETIRAQMLEAAEYVRAADIAHALDYDGHALVPSDIEALRIDGVLLGVPDHDQWLYPTFQFVNDGFAPHPVMYEVARFISPGENPWALLVWWLSPNDLLGDRAPAELLKRGSTADLSQLLDAIADVV